MANLTWVQIFILAALLEALVQVIKWVAERNDPAVGLHWERFVALGGGVALCLLAGIDLFLIVGLPLKFPYVGQVLTGLLISRGATVLHDLKTLIDTFTGALTPARR